MWPNLHFVKSIYYAKVMSVFHDEVEIEDFEYDKEEEIYYYPCPCGDRFQISKVSNHYN